MTAPILILLVSIVLIFAEVFFPTFGTLGLIAFGGVVTSIALAFREGTTAGVVFLAVAVASCISAVFFGYRLLPLTPFGKKLFLLGEEPTPDERRGIDPRMAKLQGKQGVTASMLRPSGIVEIEGHRVDAQSRGDLIETGQAVKVVEVQGNRVIVVKV